MGTPRMESQSFPILVPVAVGDEVGCPELYGPLESRTMDLNSALTVPEF